MSKFSKLEAIAETPLSDLIVTTPHERSMRSFKKLICSPPVIKTEPASALAVPADSGQAGGKPSIYATFYQNRALFISEVRVIWAAQDEIDLLNDLHKLSSRSWLRCKDALRFELRDRVESIVTFGLLLFLVEAA